MSLNFQNTIRELECTNEELTVDVTRLRCEVEEYKKEIQEWCKKERERVSIVESNAILQSKLSQASTESTKKQAEIVRLNGEVGKLRGELERIRLGSVINQPSEALSITVSQLQSALNLERENVKEILKGKESVTKENLDLKRQVKELETIVKRRVKSGNNLPFVSETPMGTHDNKLRESLEHKNKELEQQIVSYQAELSKNQDKIMDMQAKYDHDIICLEQQLKKVQQENSTLKQSLDENIPKSARRLNSASSMSNAASVKEDAHLLATIRGLKLELGTRDKEIMRLNKELEDTKKTNRRLQKEREKALTTNKARGNSH
ncbi:hypothetical protein AAG570_003776 [Ranatra chinensis]|uniref:Uncharacterized protein n=1 Tax=Ranatra chinensis TaxID=642074 RepID=A0ABD0Y4L3_9HEMI